MHGAADRANARPGDIVTPRLILRPASAAMLRADLGGRVMLARALGAHVTDDWPPDLYDAGAITWTLRAVEADPAAAAWLGYYFLRPVAGASPVLIGVGGYKGPPDNGAVEVGYSIVRSERRRGYATEAVRGFLAHAFSDPRVERVTAETLPDLVASIGVLEKVGMKLVGRARAASAGEPGWREPDVIRFEIERARYESMVPDLPASGTA